jgi:hypothetical protein
MTNEPITSLFDNPVKPGLKELQWLNEGKNDGFVNIMRDDEKHSDLIPVIQIPQKVINDPNSCLPGFLEWFESELTDDCYANVNAFFWRDNSYSEQAEKYNLIDPNNNKPLHKPITGQGKKKNLRWFNAVFVDLDVYKANLTQGQALGMVIDMMDSKRIPPVSWVKNSGKGLWLFWALHPTRYWNKTELDSLPTYERLQRQIRLIFKGMESDRQAVNANRVSRIYGSRNHKSQTLVSLWQRTDANGNMARYTLDELEVFFGTYPRKHRFQEYNSVAPDEITTELAEDQPSPSRRRLGIIGQASRWELDLKRFWILAEVIRQKRIKEGTRNAHVWILAAILKHVLTYRKLDPKQRAAEIDAAASRLWECFEDPSSYELSTVLEQLTSTLETQQRHTAQEQHMIKISHQVISDNLAITTDEAAQLADLIQGTRKDRHWPPAAGQAPIGPKKATRAEQAQIRRDYLARFHTRGNRPDYRNLANKIQEATGLDCSAPTARADWQAVFPPSRAKWITKSFIDP